MGDYFPNSYNKPRCVCVSIERDKKNLIKSQIGQVLVKDHAYYPMC